MQWDQRQEASRTILTGPPPGPFGAAVSRSNVGNSNHISRLRPGRLGHEHARQSRNLSCIAPGTLQGGAVIRKVSRVCFFFTDQVDKLDHNHHASRMLAKQLYAAFGKGAP